MRRFVTSTEGLMAALTAAKWHTTPSRLLHVRDGVVSYALDEALALRLVTEEGKAAPSSDTGAFNRLDQVLRRRAPRMTPDGLVYADPRALYAAEMEQRRREGLTH